MELQGKVSVITGATSGIGLATLERFVEEGAIVVFCGRRQERAMEIIEELKQKGYPGEAHFFQCDVSVEADVKAMAEYTKENFGNCEVLVQQRGHPCVRQNPRDQAGGLGPYYEYRPARRVPL